MGYRNYSTSNGLIVAKDGNGDFSTIASAQTAATTGHTIFIRPGTYTENLTLKAGVNLSAFGSDSSLNGTGDVIISGNSTFSGAGTVTISGIQLQTNSAALLTVSGSSASVVNLQNCYLNATNNSAITFSSSSASSQINLKSCRGDLGTTGINIFTQTAAGFIFFMDCDWTNTGASTTASTASSGSVFVRRSVFASPITTSSTAGMSTLFAHIDTAATNTTPFTTGGSGNHLLLHSSAIAGTASAVTINNTCALIFFSASSSNTNVITGSGTLQHAFIAFPSSSSGVNTTTVTALATLI